MEKEDTKKFNYYLLIFLPLESISQIGAPTLLEDVRNPSWKLKLSRLDVPKDGGPIGVACSSLAEKVLDKISILNFKLNLRNRDRRSYSLSFKQDL